MREHVAEVTGGKRVMVREVRCDLCGKPGSFAAPGKPNAEWEDPPKALRTAETQVSFHTGVTVHDEVCGTLTWFDICPDCFQGRLVPWLETQGARPNAREQHG